MQNWANDVLCRMVDKFTWSAGLAAPQGLIPYKGGKNDTWIGSPSEDNSWWTGGFWPALMWQMYAVTQNDLFREDARRVQGLLYKELQRHHGMHHDVGFMFLISFGADFLQHGNEADRAVVLHAADVLAGRFNPAGFIRAWNGEGREGWAIVDCLMNLTLLHWATAQTGDPRYAAIAGIHADTTIKHFVRQDGSCNHIVVFDANTGEPLAFPGGQGYCSGSSWSRGQAWALYGFALLYHNTREQKYLDAAKRVAHYFIANIRSDGLTNCDFRQPEGEERIDNIAAACASCGLLELADLVPELEAEMYRSAAIRMLKALDELSSDWSHECCGVLQKCTAAYHQDNAGRHENIVYGDYFFAEAIARLCGKAPGIWYAQSK